MHFNQYQAIHSSQKPYKCSKADKPLIKSQSLVNMGKFILEKNHTNLRIMKITFNRVKVLVTHQGVQNGEELEV